uniref:TrkA C-terminal domain-containing protein n=1 Tax=Dialister sp. TaxID=1955814 RepID=UPI004024B2EE
MHVTKKSRYYQKSLSSLHLPHGHLVVLILRQGEVIIPKGDTVLEAGDVMVMNGKN